MEGDLPVENRSQLHLVIVIARLRPHLELINLAHPRGDRAHLRVAHARGNALAGLLQPLVNQRSRPVDVGALFEGHGHGGEAKAADRADFFHPRQAAHRVLDRKGNELLDFDWAEGGREGQHLHLHVGQVGHGVERQAGHRAGADAQQHHCQQHDNKAVVE